MNADFRLLCISKDGIGLQYLWMGFREFHLEPHSFSQNVMSSALQRSCAHGREQRKPLFRLSAVRYQKHQAAPCEARTHDLQIMRLTRCLTAPTRPVGQRAEKRSTSFQVLACRCSSNGSAPAGRGGQDGRAV